MNSTRYLPRLGVFCVWLPVLFLSMTMTASGEGAHANAAARAFNSLRMQFMEISPEGMASAAVRNLTISRDCGTILLHEGRLFLCSSVGNRHSAVVFRGRGLFNLRPPVKEEREQLFRFLQKDSVREEFTDLFLLFADTTAQELMGRCTFAAGPVDPEAASFARKSVRLLADEKTGEFHASFMRTFLEGEQSDLFLAEFASPQAGVLYFMIDPLEEEEISFGWRRANLLHSVLEPIAVFPRQASPGAWRTMRSSRTDRLAATHYTIESTIEGDLDFQAHARMAVRSLAGDQRWLLFSLFSELTVDSVLWRPGVPAEFVRAEDSWDLWVRSPEPLSSGQVCSLQVFYRGDLLRKDDFDWIHIKAPSDWYPRCGYRVLAHYDLTFRTPAKYSFVSIGERVSVEKGEDETVSRWVSWGPARNASFNLGFFTETVIDDKRIPPVTVLMAETGHRQIASAMVAKGMLTGSDMEEQVAADIANSMSFYQIVYGECPVPRLYATEIPDYHGEAFPGLIHLSWITYQSTSHEGEDHAFRAHEVAHQWWGIGVDFATYHDQWLSEGFSEYSALWYTQMALRNNAKFFDLLDRYRDLILSNRHYLFGKGQEAGPIWLGYRTHSSETAGDYDLVVYRKGAWVLHMLRNMMLDLQTMNEDRFKSMMRDFYSSFRGKKAATRDFEVFVSKHMGQDMIWFFRQWVYDTVIPKYTFAYRVEETPEGKYHVQCRVAQEGVSDNFQMPVPLLIKFDGERFARVRVMVTGPQKTIDLGLLPLKPESIEFNDLHSVLCEVDTESWD